MSTKIECVPAAIDLETEALIEHQQNIMRAVCAAFMVDERMVRSTDERTRLIEEAQMARERTWHSLNS